VNRYYNAINHVNITGLYDPSSVVVSSGSLSTTSNPRIGDIVYFSYGHWALVKAISGSIVTLIEQNWKWLNSNDNYWYAAKDRKIYTTGHTFLRWCSDKCGDMNNDNVVDIVDALAIAQYSVGIYDNAFNPQLADVNLDGKVDILDALIVANFYVETIPYLPWTGPIPN